MDENNMVVTSELTGVVLEVLVTAGSQVQAGDALLLIESMKMEFPVAAPVDGTVLSVAVAAQDAIAEGEMLVLLQRG